MDDRSSSTKLTRHLGLTGLAATGICSMIGASIYVVPFMIQRNVPGIGPNVIPAFLFAAIPALLAAFAYAMLSSAMPRAGGSYVYASRGLHPYLGFVASFSQWFGLSIVIGVIAYVIVPFFRDIALALEQPELAAWFDKGFVRVGLALLMLWIFVLINIRGIKAYVRALIPLMLLMFGLGIVVIYTGFSFNHTDFAAEVPDSVSTGLSDQAFNWNTFLAAAAILFSSFIGFDAIAQAGGEAKEPARMLPRAIGIAIVGVGLYYFAFTSAVYHAVPWQYVAEQALKGDITATGLLQPIIPFALGVVITTGAAIALINDLPAMILSVSRLVFAWSGDGIFPKSLSKTHERHHTPHRALILSGFMASIGILGSHFAGDFFLGIDIMVLAMLVNFLLMCMTVLAIKKRNPELAGRIEVIKSRWQQRLVAWLGVLFLSGFILVHVVKDFQTEVSHWYFRSTPVWLLVMALGSVIFLIQYLGMMKEGIDAGALFKKLPEE
ncbi:MAG: APC family permease [Roseivirga sp.]|nr:APC family permease [Roseivirga sp.]